MALIVNLVIFLAAGAIIWLFAGMLVRAVGRLSARFRVAGFVAAFFVLGSLTSVSEISVAINSTLGGVPQVSVGNLVGASFVVLLFIVPLLAYANRGITLGAAVSDGALLAILGAVALPALLVIDGSVTVAEGVLSVLAYASVGYVIYRQRCLECVVDATPVLPSIAEWKATATDVAKVVMGAAAVFLASDFLVAETTFFAAVLGVPASIIGLVVLSIGTNLPELAVAVRSILMRRADIAFGDYLGSAVTNTLIFGGVAIASGSFLLERAEFVITVVLLVGGLLCLYIFSRSKATLSRNEGAVLLLFYAAFLVFQIVTAVRLAGE
jgi:cation:H+ antiporter